ncbi:MAG: TonB-dependent receptor [Pseudomonadota bacterium]
MSHYVVPLRRIAVGAAAASMALAPVAAAQSSGLEEVVVTAQKISQNINDIGMSIDAASGEKLQALGVTDTADLVKIVPGFNFTETLYGSPVYSIRGVGYVETTLSAGPTVSVYSDEVPIPFTSETKGTTLDVRRVEVLKGPQGTLYGQNSTGGAINYIPNKPTDELDAGFNASYGRFDTRDVEGFVSGAVTDTLRGRLAVRSTHSDGWQESYTRDDELGAQDFFNARLTLEWDPTDRLRTRLTLSGWHDQSESTAPQFFDVVPRSETGVVDLDPDYVNYPRSPRNPRDADWNPEEEHERDNRFYMASLRADYDLTPDLTLTSLSAYQKFHREQPLEGDGTAFQNYYSDQMGEIDTWYQELRLTGSIDGRGNWIVGANYEQDSTFDQFHQYYGDATSAYVLGVYGPDSVPETHQDIETWAVFANAEYPVLEDVTLQAGVRYTDAERDFKGCSRDGNDPSNPGWGGQSEAIQAGLVAAGVKDSVTPIPPGGCATLNVDQNFDPAFAYKTLEEDNVSWRLNANWNVAPETLLYANVSQGYKAGSFPTLAVAQSSQFQPATQEKLLAYETGFKATLFDGSLQWNGAGFYYDYEDKQILGDILDPVFGPLPALVNVPESHVVGFETSMNWSPVEGLTINPSVSYQKSEVDGEFENFNSFGEVEDFSGEAFPVAPKVQADLDVRYQWSLTNDMQAFVGAHANYQDDTYAFFGEDPDLKIDSYTLVDLRAGVQRGPWEVSAWGRNVTDEYYWNNVSYAADSMVRFTGMPATYGLSVNYRMQ